MSLDIKGLEVVNGSGTKKEQIYARALLPLRAKGNFLLCTLLLGNTAVNAVLAIFLGSMTSGLMGTLISTFAIVCFGEIIPQSLCSRYGLAIGYYTRFIVIFFMFLIGIIAYPISALLDCIMGRELGNVYNKAQLTELLKVHGKSNDVNDEELHMLQVMHASHTGTGPGRVLVWIVDAFVS